MAKDSKNNNLESLAKGVKVKLEKAQNQEPSRDIKIRSINVTLREYFNVSPEQVTKVEQYLTRLEPARLQGFYEDSYNYLGKMTQGPEKEWYGKSLEEQQASLQTLIATSEMFAAEAQNKVVDAQKHGIILAQRAAKKATKLVVKPAESAAPAQQLGVISEPLDAAKIQGTREDLRMIDKRVGQLLLAAYDLYPEKGSKREVHLNKARGSQAFLDLVNGRNSNLFAGTDIEQKQSFKPIYEQYKKSVGSLSIGLDDFMLAFKLQIKLDQGRESNVFTGAVEPYKTLFKGAYSGDETGFKARWEKFTKAAWPSPVDFAAYKHALDTEFAEARQQLSGDNRALLNEIDNKYNELVTKLEPQNTEAQRSYMRLYLARNLVEASVNDYILHDKTLLKPFMALNPAQRNDLVVKLAEPVVEHLRNLELEVHIKEKSGGVSVASVQNYPPKLVAAIQKVLAHNDLSQHISNQNTGSRIQLEQVDINNINKQLGVSTPAGSAERANSTTSLPAYSSSEELPTYLPAEKQPSLLGKLPGISSLVKNFSQALQKFDLKSALGSDQQKAEGKSKGKQ